MNVTFPDNFPMVDIMGIADRRGCKVLPDGKGFRLEYRYVRRDEPLGDEHYGPEYERQLAETPIPTVEPRPF